MGGQSGHVGRQVAPSQQAAVHTRVQCFDPSVEHFRKTGQLGHLSHRQALLRQQLGRTARGDQANAKGVQPLRESNNAGFVGYRQQRVHHRQGLNGGVGGGSASGSNGYLTSLCSSNFLRSVLRFKPSH